MYIGDTKIKKFIKKFKNSFIRCESEWWYQIFLVFFSIGII